MSSGLLWRILKLPLSLKTSHVPFLQKNSDSYCQSTIACEDARSIQELNTERCRHKNYFTSSITNWLSSMN